MAQENNNTSKNAVGEIDLREELEKYLRYWPWFLIFVLIALGLAYLKLRYTTPVYSTTATIIIKDGKNSQNSEMAVFAELGMLGGMNGNSIQNEIGILRSRRLMENVVKELDLHIRYFDEEIVRTPELYTSTPLKVQVLSTPSNQAGPDGKVRLTYIGNNKVEIIGLQDEKVFTTELGTPVDVGFATLMVVQNELLAEKELKKEQPILVSLSPVERVAGTYRNDLNVRIKESNSSLIELSLNDAVRTKAEDILDQLILEYNREAIEDKNLVAMNTAEFIEERLAIINEELDSVETGKVIFKERNEMTDIQAESQEFISNAGELKRRQQELTTQLQLTEAMIAYLRSSSASELLPANLGIEESAVNQEINEYNRLVLEHNRVLNGSTKKNPVVIRLSRQMEDLRSNVLQSLTRLKENLRIAESNLNRQAAAVGSRIAAVPSKEKQFRGIERQQQIKETLYLFLLQKREENSLSLAVASPKAKIVDTAFSAGIPISPVPRNTYLTALLLGLGIPFGFIYLKNLLNNKIRERGDIEEITTDIPIIGEIPELGSRDNEMIGENDRSVLAESFRILHTNLQFIDATKKTGDDNGNLVCVTSTIKGEGKTFTAFNFALTLANTGKKVLIVGADLRNPQLQRFERNARQLPGVSDYLVNDEFKLEEIITGSSLHNNLDLLASGTIPPNPSELWRSKKTPALFSDLRSRYDYVIVDTAPSLLVTDTFLINPYVDCTLYVTRAGYTEKKLINFPIDSKNQKKLKNTYFVLNGVKTANFGYGNKYGYAYGEETIGFWYKLKNRVAFW